MKREVGTDLVPGGEGGTRQQVRLGLTDSVPIALGYLPLGIAYGVFAVTMGLEWYWALITALIIYAGSIEFLAVAMITGGMPLGQVALTAFLVNFRHIFYGLSFPLHKIRSKLGRLYAIHALTDETFAVVAAKDSQQLTGKRLLTISISAQIYWGIGTLLGALATTLLQFDAPFIEFALTALFVMLAIDAYKVYPNPKSAVVALALAITTMILVPDQMLLISLSAYAMLVVGRIMYSLRGQRALIRLTSKGRAEKDA